MNANALMDTTTTNMYRETIIAEGNNDSEFNKMELNLNEKKQSDKQNQIHTGGSINGRPHTGLRRQPTKYPHGLGSISVQTISDEHQLNYSRASTLRSNWDTTTTTTMMRTPPKNGMNTNNTNHHEFQTNKNSHRKYRISMISNPENLAELQVRRYKYPLTGNYYLDTQEAAATSKSTAAAAYKMFLEYTKRYCKWKYLRWPIIFLASVLLFFGLITYCIWLHDVSVARDKYLQQRYQFSDGGGDEAATQANLVLSFTANTIELHQRPPTPTATTTTERVHRLQESTILRAIGTRARQRPKEQKLTTALDYDVSKGEIEWEKGRKYESEMTAASLPIETTTIAADEETLVPVNAVHFTSGHQNSFGVPIEEDERILRLINGLFPLNQPESSTVNTLAKVSPTIPPLPQSQPTSAMNYAMRNTAQENGCHSPMLPMCQGVLEYDLTYNASINLDPFELEDYEKLINSNCSSRAIEFVCATLEPECRPSHIGVLPPCRRICKAILEACSIIISNSDTLSATFDCNAYPDSADPHKCEDPTRRRGYCYDNEFECYDRSCIPYQWQCDNIKDCAAGEDEESCLICDHQDEFRCRSNEKCIPETSRCDLKFDCFDGSDEDDCEEYGSGEQAAEFDETELNAFPRVFSYASFLSPNQSNDKLYTYITASTDDETGTKFKVHEITNRTSGVSSEEVTNNVPGEGPKGFVNFRDSKEIMMTSDSENKFKYSAARANRTSSKFSTGATTPLKPAASMRIAVTTEAPPRLPVTCAAHQLRCVSGKCITVAQLCDKKIDCPDGADELMCVYKERTTTVRNNNGSASTIVTTSRQTTQTSDKRTLRTTTIKRKVKT